MPKTVRHFHSAKLKSIKKLTDASRGSGSRKHFIGKTGELYVIESRNKYPGKCFVRFTNHDTMRFSTGFGFYGYDGSTLKMTTDNSVYEFEIIEK